MRRTPMSRGGTKPRMAKLVTRNRPALAAAGLIAATLAALALGVPNSLHLAPGEAKASAELFKNPHCRCCERYAAYLRTHGYAVSTTATHNLSLIRRERGITGTLAGCHTMIVGDYVVEGHVPAALLDKLLADRPKIKGISLPGMPQGSPGMAGAKVAPFTIYEISEGPADRPARVYAIE